MEYKWDDHDLNTLAQLNMAGWEIIEPNGGISSTPFDCQRDDWWENQ
jgi:hypothetical protein